MYLVVWRTKVTYLYIDLQIVKEPQATIQMPQAATTETLVYPTFFLRFLIGLLIFISGTLPM